MASTPRNEGDGLDDLMELEAGFYDEGFKAGLEDGTQAGLTEGKLFGIQKGYEKALEMGKLRGRAIVWNSRLSDTSQSTNIFQANSQDKHDMNEVAASLPRFENNDRLKKHVEALLQMTNGEGLDVTNSDDAVAAFDDLLIKARNKAKVISNITGEPIGEPVTDGATTGIEDARGLSARH